MKAIYTGSQLTSLAHYSSGQTSPDQTSPDQTLQIAYNAGGRIERITDPDSRQTVFHYDAGNLHLTSVDYFDGRSVGYTYSIGQGAAKEQALTEITYPGATAGTFTHQYFTYDAQGRLAGSYRDGNAEHVDFAYDSAGKVTATNTAGDAGQFYFDHRGLLVKTVDGLGNAVTLAYDNAYNLTAVTDPSGHSYTYGYDANGNLVRSTDANGSITRFTYTGAYNRLASVTDGNGHVTRYAYEPDGDLASITYADGSRESWAYDPLGQPTAWTNRRGNATPDDPNDHVIGYAYDSDGHLTSKTYADGSHVDYAYDTRGNLHTATDATGTTTFTYGPATDRLTRIDYLGGKWLELTYNAAGQRETSRDQTGHRLTYHYDTVGRLDYIENESGVREVDYDYDAAGRLVLNTLGNGVYTTYDYDHAGQLLHLVNYQPNHSVLSRFDYTYDTLGRRISMITLDGAWSYSYDDIGQLTRAVLDSTNPAIPDQDLTYVYDALGNRIRTVTNGVTTEYTTNNMNQYVNVGGVTYRYDADGNLIQEGTTTYAYNDENRLVAVTAGANSWQYTYDALGNRVATTENGTTTRYVVDPIGLGNVVGEYNASGSLIAHYDYGFGLASRISDVGNAAYYTFDAIGNTSELVGANDTDRYAFDPFGQPLSVTEPIPNPFEYVGEFGVIKEGNGLSFMRARYYGSDVGRFITADPLHLAGDDVNLYRYAYNAPSEWIDPLGQAPKDYAKSFAKWAAVKGFEIAGPKLGVPEAAGMGFYLNTLTFVQELNQASSVWDRMHAVGVYGLKTLLNARFPGLKVGGLLVSWFDQATKDLGQWIFRVPAPVVEAPQPPADSQASGGSGVSTSSDPNEKTGPAGFGAAGFISADNLFAYRVDFENESSATAPAQIVTVTDQLDSDLDWSSFALTEIGFGDQLIAVPDNTQHFEQTVPMTYNGTTFEVQIEAGIRSDTGQVYANFYSIDPNTGLPPSVLVGFLPPEDNTGRGMGHFSYTINADPGLPTGAEIRNVALIQFDHGEIIATNQVDPHDPSKGADPNKEALNTIDTGTPGSNVLPLPPTIAQADFLVQWTGEDDAGGSGIASYDIYASTDGSAYALWRDDTAETSATYSGQSGHSYAFYSVARDQVGYVEAAPETPDARITVLEAGQQSGRIEGAKFEDLDGDGVRDAGELGLAGWIIYLDQDRSGQREEGEPFTTTDETGAYGFNGLVPGTYVVAEALQAGWVRTAPEGGAYDVVLAGGETVTGIEFGNFHLGEIAGVKFQDLDRDGVRDAGESGLSGWVIFLDAISNNTLDADEPRTTTDGTGAYAFIDLGPGTYRVAEVAQVGWTQSAPASGVYELTLTSGLVATGRDFGNLPANRAPVAADDAYTLDEDSVLTVAAPGVLGNDTDADGDPLTAALVNGPAHGALTLNPDGSFTYRPAPDFNGADTFTYLAQDGRAESAPATVAIAEVPTSSVNPLPAIRTNDRFTVSWSGSDHAGDASIAFFDVFVSMDGDPFEPLLLETTETSATFQGEDGRTYSFFSVATDHLGHRETDPGSPDATTTVDLVEVVIGTGANKAVTYTDADGTATTVILKGGTATVAFRGENIGQAVGKKGVTVAGEDVEIAEVALANTTSKSSLTFTSKGGDGFATVGEISGDVPVGKVTGKGIDLGGIAMTGNGYVAAIDLHAILEGADLRLPGAGNLVGTTLKAVRIGAGTEIELGSGLKSLTATEWLDGSLRAPWAAKIAIAGDFGADLVLSGAGNPKQTLGNLTVKGNAKGNAKANERNVLWKIDGAVGKVNVAGWLEEIDLRAMGPVTSVTAGGARKSWLFVGVKDSVQELPDSRDDFVGGLPAEIKSLTIKGIPGAPEPSFEGSMVAAPSLGKVTIKGVETVNGGTPFGIAADRIKSYARMGIRPLSNLDSLGVTDQEGDYVVRLL